MFRFCSKTVPQRSGGIVCSCTGERSVAIQELPPHVGYRLVTNIPGAPRIFNPWGEEEVRLLSAKRVLRVVTSHFRRGHCLVTGEAPEPNSHAGTRMRI